VIFEDVAGIDKAVTELQTTVEMMVGDVSYDKMGARVPKGVLLEGPPGTGKTLLAKAVASEGGLPFFSANGSEFVEMFVGVAAARIRDLFRRAREQQPAVVFVDEIDTIGKARGGDDGDPSRKEREQGLLQLLSEMDGVVSKDDQVLVMAATNMKEKLDEALLRSGRFDRDLRLDLPSERARYDILKVHARGKQVGEEGDEQFQDNALLRRAAQLTVGFSGAELANVMNEAAILAVRRQQSQITLSEIEAAMDKQRLGLLRQPLPMSEYKRHLATMQAGRAVAASVNDHVCAPVLQVSILPKGQQSSRLLTVPLDRDGLKNLITSEGYKDMLAVALVGRISEEVFLGYVSATTMTSAELTHATRLAAQLASETGVVEGLDLLSMSEETAPYFPLFQQRLSVAVSVLLEEAGFRARCILYRYQAAVETVRDKLLEKETLYGDEVVQVRKQIGRSFTAFLFGASGISLRTLFSGCLRTLVNADGEGLSARGSAFGDDGEACGTARGVAGACANGGRLFALELERARESADEYGGCVRREPLRGEQRQSWICDLQLDGERCGPTAQGQMVIPAAG
jgi:cell division protease FtsH